MLSLVAGAALASIEDDYQKAKTRLTAFSENVSHHKYRDKWMSLIDSFMRIHNKNPKHSRACDSLYNVGGLYRDMADVSHLASDRRMAAQTFERLDTECSSSSLADDGLYNAAMVYVRLGDTDNARRVLTRLLARYPKGDMAGKARALLKELGGEPVQQSPADAPKAVTQSDTKPPATAPQTSQGAPKAMQQETNQTQAENLGEPSGDSSQGFEMHGGTLIAPRSGPAELESAVFESAVTFTRLKLTFSRLPAMTSGEVPASDGLPRRLYFDFVDTKLGSTVANSVMDVRDSRVIRIRIGQFGPTVVRIVFEVTEQAGSFGLSNMIAPPVTSIDIKGKVTALPPVAFNEPPAVQKPKEPIPSEPSAPKQAVLEPAGPKKTVEKSDPAKDKDVSTANTPTLSRGIKVVVIDPGHGGDDTGAIGRKGTREKDITLQIARRVKTLLEKHGIKVILTRNSDKTMDLIDRTKIANAANADLFLSIHCNANVKSKFTGVEVFYLNNSSDTYSTRLADRENKVLGKQISDLEFILTDLSMNVNIGDSIILANMMQKSLVKALRSKYSNIVDRGVRRAVFHVLLYARMPAVLVETSFLSNPTEEARLRTSAYQQQIAEGIVAGVLRYSAKIKVSSSMN
jgi:N-acetylmuramoyl-L-alanine amidase